MFINTKIAYLLLMIILIDVAQAAFSDVPPPPPPPQHLLTREELKRYLQKVHEYHSILGRWRIRRDFNKPLHAIHFPGDYIDYHDRSFNFKKTNPNLFDK